MATYQHQVRGNSSRNSDSEGRYKVSVSGPRFHIECTLYRDDRGCTDWDNQCSVLVTDDQGRQTKIVVDVKEVDTLKVLPVSIHPTDDSYQHGNSGVGFDSASQTPGSPGTDRTDEEIGSLRSDEGCSDWRERHCKTCTCAVTVRPRSPSVCAPGMPEE